MVKKQIFIVAVIALFIITPIVLIANSSKNKNVDCSVGEFGDFSVCSKTCGGGTQSRTRKVITPKTGNGKECPSLEETRECNNQICPVNCRVSDFTDYDECSKTCGGGTQSRYRTITQNQIGTGDPCPNLSETIECNPQPCSMNISSPPEFITQIFIPCDTINTTTLKYVDIGTLNFDGILISTRLIGEIYPGGVDDQLGVYLRKTTDNSIVTLSITRFIDQPPGYGNRKISFEASANSTVFQKGDKIGVFMNSLYCEWGYILNPTVNIQYTNL